MVKFILILFIFECIKAIGYNSDFSLLDLVFVLMICTIITAFKPNKRMGDKNAGTKRKN